MQEPTRSREWDAARIKEVRDALGLTKEGFAHMLGVTVGTVWHWEAGTQRPRGLSVRRLDEILASQVK